MKQSARKVAFLLADGYEDSEMKNPYDAFRRRPQPDYVARPAGRAGVHSTDDRPARRVGVLIK